ncbi:DNA polymerase-3 subunit epsilon [Pustulibacterium marinum]|uniref:DNA polymerase-3 subunit epsilon n=1 Tax=Pustulibacterium marinum TaxID=1224947 RepID=A0A1I7INT4_9FLAO|nr:3'-5' exonuclease [Pustulibacterium marinum]SFU74580.1 DNA polymerase-3 subunit epsilon [Pustulibacterium marinum]
MFNWFQKKKIEYPQFWIDYKSHFQEEDLKIPLKDVTFVVLDTETTGFSYEDDRMLCIGAIKAKENIIDLKSSFEIYIKQEAFNPESVEIHGLMKNHNYETVSEIDALKMFLAYVENAIIVAHHTNFDITMINKALERNGLPLLLNRTLDTAYLFKKTKAINTLLKNDRGYSLDEVCKELNIPIKDRHTAAGDAMLTAQAFLKTLARLNFKQNSTLKSLLRK